MALTCLSIHQPWASLVAHGIKHYAAASRATRYRGEMGVIACKNAPPCVRHALQDEDLARFARRVGIEYDPTSVTGLGAEVPLGMLLGTVTMVDCVRLEAAPPGLQEERFLMGDAIPGRWLYVLARPRPLAKPVPTVGNIRMFRLDRAPAEAAYA